MTNREIVSIVENSLRGVSKDNLIPRRYILNILRDNAKNLISQKLLDRTLTQEENIYTSISCIEMDNYNVIKCDIAEFRLCKFLMRSKTPLPTPVYSRLGSSIREITSIDTTEDIIIISPQQYRRNSKRKGNLHNNVYAYIDSKNYLWIPDKEIYAVNLKMITLESEKIKTCDVKECRDYWEDLFTCPDKLITSVIAMSVEFILKTYKSIQPDSNPNTIENV